MYRPEIAYQKRTWNSREQNHLPRYPLPDWPTAWPTVEGAGFCPHYPRSTPSHILLRHPTVEGDFVFGNPGRINAHTQKQSAERAAPSSSAQRFALAAGGRLFRRRCANRSACNQAGSRRGWCGGGASAKSAEGGTGSRRAVACRLPGFPNLSHREQNHLLTHFSLPMCHFRKTPPCPTQLSRPHPRIPDVSHQEQKRTPTHFSLLICNIRKAEG